LNFTVDLTRSLNKGNLTGVANLMKLLVIDKDLQL